MTHATLPLPTRRLTAPAAARYRPSWEAPVVPVEPPDAHVPQHSELADRVLNATVAAFGLILVAPVLALVALAVRLTSRGPVIYTQERVGLDRRWRRHDVLHTARREDVGGKPFTIFKFRSMRVDAESGTGAVWATRNDPRLTPIGGFLRASRLDELPQLVNVLIGDMNIVGPRPERPTLVVQLREQVDDYQKRQRVKPGITGWAQINQAYDTTLEDVRSKVQYDLEYLRRKSAGHDLMIMARTVPVMLGLRGW
jgi:lipopolysaccharide/colanic/teichoic acid biosynthesis glycosyltransferase